MILSHAPYNTSGNHLKRAKYLLALSSGIQKWFWLGHRVKTAVSGKGNWAWHWLCHNQSNLSFTGTENTLSFLWSQWRVAQSITALCLTQMNCFHLCLDCSKNKICTAVRASLPKMKKSLFTVQYKGFVESFILISCKLYLHREIKKEQDGNQRKQA